MGSMVLNFRPGKQASERVVTLTAVSCGIRGGDDPAPENAASCLPVYII